MVEPMTDEELERLKNVALHGPVPALTVAKLVARLDAVERERDQFKAKAELFQHIGRCEQCQGPHDGCETGQCLEHRCVCELDFDPYRVDEKREDS